MSLEKVVPFVSKGGNEYLIEFKIFKPGIDFDVPIIDVSLVLVNSQAISVELSDLFHLSLIIHQYILENDVVLYYYCDDEEVIRSGRHKMLLPQEYRNRLFGHLFNRINSNGLLREEIVFSGDTNKDIHYISLITAETNEKILESIVKEVYKINDK